jgi:hypothetical protein
VEVNRLAALDPWKTFVPSSFQCDSLLYRLVFQLARAKVLSGLWIIDSSYQG